MGHMVKYPDRRDGSTLFDFYGNIIPASGGGLVFTAKGDIPVGTGPGAGVMQAVGTNGQFLSADSTQADGVKWVNLSVTDVDTIFTAAGQIAVGTGLGTGELLAKGGAGTVLTVGGADPSGLEWIAQGAKTFNISHTWALMGVVANSASTAVPPFFAPVLAAGQTMTLVEADYQMLSGTCTVAVDQNGTPVTGLTALSVTGSPAHTAATGPPSVASRDLFSIVITSAASTPLGLTVTLVFSVTV